jgi:hypothetical protein
MGKEKGKRKKEKGKRRSQGLVGVFQSPSLLTQFLSQLIEHVWNFRSGGNHYENYELKGSQKKKIYTFSGMVLYVIMI